MVAHKIHKYNYVANNVSKGSKYKIICIYDYTYIAKNRTSSQFWSYGNILFLDPDLHSRLF